MRLYTPEKEGSKELLGIKDCVGSEHGSLNLYQVKGGELLRKYAGKIKQPMLFHRQFEKVNKTINTKKSWRLLTKVT